MNMNEKEIIELVHSTKSIIYNKEMAHAVTVKGAADYVTKVDVAVQEYLRKELDARTPDVILLAEEQENNNLDPAKSYLIHDYRMSAVSLGLYENGQMTFGVVYNPFTEETFHASLGKGAFLTGEPIHVSHREALDTCIIAFGSAPYEKERASMLFPIFQRVFMETADFRRSASAALDLCYLAAGRIDGFFELNLKPWDYAAGSLIIEEAGGKITDWNGTRLPFLANSDILTCTPEIYERIKKLLKH